MYIVLKCSLITQLVECLTVNQNVPGSSPGQGAKSCFRIMVLQWICNPLMGVRFSQAAPVLPAV